MQQNTENELYDVAITTKLFYQGVNEKNVAFLSWDYRIMRSIGIVCHPVWMRYRGRIYQLTGCVNSDIFVIVLSMHTPNIVFESDNPAAVKI